MKVESTNGCLIELRDFGGTGPDLIISHATGFHGGAYAPMATKLVDHFHVWALDFRGHGASDSPADSDFAWAGISQDLVACIDAIGVDSILAFGHSLGGAATLLAELDRPGLIRAAYLFEPIVFPQGFLLDRKSNPMTEPARRRREVFDSRADALWRYASKPPLSSMRADALAAYVEHGFIDLPNGTVRLACRGENEARTFEGEKLNLNHIAELEIPLTVAFGKATAEWGPAMLAPGVVETVANGTLVEHEFLGHFGPFESPDLIAADVLKALNSMLDGDLG